MLGLLCLWLVLSAAASIGRELPVLGTVRTHLTGQVEKALGMHQTWTMFVPNAPRESYWLVATGRTVQGRNGPVPSLVGQLPVDRIEWSYRRTGKLERNAAKPGKQGALRRGWAHWRCEEERRQRRTWETILLEKESRSTPAPEARAEAGPRETWPLERTRLSRQACPWELE